MNIDVEGDDVYIECSRSELAYIAWEFDQAARLTQKFTTKLQPANNWLGFEKKLPFEYQRKGISRPTIMAALLRAVYADNN